MTCANCQHWRLVGSLGQAGFGQCAVRHEQLRTAITTPAQSVCRLGKFAAAAVPQGSLL
ncbi:hypothetical protein [Variovorax sp. DXTD-1]|uniref:hypothetical protein n=1 Tax=Variovorax sp. DXTD-1 TaxID=2495592 RepID=UPI00163C7232|nr:hypothetical protein [Variovorax sp. DXTD-1]